MNTYAVDIHLHSFKLYAKIQRVCSHNNLVLHGVKMACTHVRVRDHLICLTML